MKPDASHIRDITVVSNTHWDREFRKSFERTRRLLLDMMDRLLNILETDPAYHSFTLDAHCIPLEDYLELRPENRPRIERLLRAGKLLAGPWYTLPEGLAVGDEAFVRNFLRGKMTCERLGGKPMPVGYTPASWGQTGQLPQILAGFGIDTFMFYRGISHHEADAEFFWEAPDGTRVLASRFALYARYNWYYLVHRVVTQGHAFDKKYRWDRNETPMRVCDGLAGNDVPFEALNPSDTYDKSRLAEAIAEMVRVEGPHFTTPHFLAMMGHDISFPCPRETQTIRDAAEAQSRWSLRHGNLMEYWEKVKASVDREALPVLKGERRSALKTGMWTYLLPGSISARTYLKQMDFDTHNRLAARAEPLAALAAALGAAYPAAYLDRAWKFLLANHTHDANGGCAPDRVGLDMEYRYRQAGDCADIATEDAMRHICANLHPGDKGDPPWRLVVFNSLPYQRRALVEVELELPDADKVKSLAVRDPAGGLRPYQIIEVKPSGVFVDSIWDVPCMAETKQFRVLVDVEDIPPVGYLALGIEPSVKTDRRLGSLVTAHATAENEFLTLRVNGDGTADIFHKDTGIWYRGLNAFRDQGEVGTAWFHEAPAHDEILTSRGGAAAQIAIVRDGPLEAVIRAVIPMRIPRDAADGTRRSADSLPHDIATFYTIQKHNPVVSIRTVINNQSLDHWFRAVFPTHIETTVSCADSHFDVVERPIAVPPSDDWVERAVGTHPLRTFVDLNDGRRGLSVFSRGLFEYEVLPEAGNPVALSLLRAVRIKLLVSEERKQELPDLGPQCLGRREFHYAVYPHAGDWDAARCFAQTRRWATPPRAAQTGRGAGSLPAVYSLMQVDREDVGVTCIKHDEAEGKAAIVRLFNPAAEERPLRLTWHRPPAAVWLVRLDETPIERIATDGPIIPLRLGPKKIVTLRIE